MNGWWFSRGYYLPHNDGREIAVGVTHSVEEPIVLCERGLHASETLLDALIYAPGHFLWKVELSGKIHYGGDKSCATHRKYTGHVKPNDVQDILLNFAEACAFSVLHLWDAPQVVLDFVNGDKTKREEAKIAAEKRTQVIFLAPDERDTMEWCAAHAMLWATVGFTVWKSVYIQPQDAARNAADSAARALLFSNEEKTLTEIKKEREEVLRQYVEEALIQD